MTRHACPGCGEDVGYMENPAAYGGRCSTCHYCGPPRSRTASGAPSWRDDTPVSARPSLRALPGPPAASTEDWRRQFLTLIG